MQPKQLPLDLLAPGSDAQITLPLKWPDGKGIFEDSVTVFDWTTGQWTTIDQETPQHEDHPTD